MRAYRVLIIDDKPIIRRSLIRTIDWTPLGCVIAGEAEDGGAGIEMIDRLRPDIILSDIRMPKLNGLQLAEYVNVHLPGAIVILITGYADFAYAQSALRLGVQDLLLKPISNKDVTAAVRKAAAALSKRRVRTPAAAEEKLDRERTRLLYRAMVQPHTGTGRLGGELEALGLPAGPYTVAACALANPEPAALVELSALLNAGRDDGDGERWMYHAFPFEGKVLMFVHAGNQRMPEIRRFVESLLYSVLQHHTLLLQNRAAACLSGIYTSADRLCEAWREALGQLESPHFMPYPVVLLPGTAAEDDNRRFEDMMQRLQRLEEKLELKNRGAVEAEVELLLANLETMSLFHVRSYIAAICVILASKLGGGNAAGMRQLLNGSLERINISHDAAACREELNAFVGKQFERRCAAAPNSFAAGILQYICEHYREPLTLASLGEQFHVNASYLSRLLKKETGKNFVEIVADIRICEAKRLLRNPAIKIAQVAESVGYNDYTYFSQVFKKCENVTPNQYRTMI